MGRHPQRAGVSGPDPDHNISPMLLCSPEILGPHNDLGVWSLSGPGRCLVLLHRDASRWLCRDPLDVPDRLFPGSFSRSRARWDGAGRGRACVRMCVWMGGCVCASVCNGGT